VCMMSAVTFVAVVVRTRSALGEDGTPAVLSKEKLAPVADELVHELRNSPCQSCFAS